MKIVDKRDDRKIPLSRVGKGAAFKYNGFIFLKVNHPENRFRTVRMDDGNDVSLSDYTLVEPVEVELHIINPV